MKILHISLRAPYNDNWGYQENLLPAYQQKAGHEVTLIVTNKKHTEKGELIEVDECDYFSDHGVKIIRKKYDKLITKKIGMFLGYSKIYNTICEINPDFIMIHGLVSVVTTQVIKYVKNVNKDCIIVADNHLDEFIHDTKKINIKLSAFYFKFRNKYWQKYYHKVYGVTPWRSKYAEDIFGINNTKIDTLFMGADDDKLDYFNRDKIRNKIRDKYGISKHDFLFITGGKIESNKKIIETIKAFIKINHINCKLLIFGGCSSDLNEEFFDLIKRDNRIIYINFINSVEVYDLFLSSDFGIFPGRHSVLWEQAVASGLPCLFKKYVDSGYVNVNGNCILLEDSSVEEIYRHLEKVLYDTNFYNNIKNLAMGEARKNFLYSEIAKKCLEI